MISHLLGNYIFVLLLKIIKVNELAISNKTYVGLFLAVYVMHLNFSEIYLTSLRDR